MATDSSMVSPHSSDDHLFACVPLKYTYLIKAPTSSYFYESNTGLWTDIDPENSLMVSHIPQTVKIGTKIIDNFKSLKKHLTSTVDLKESIRFDTRNQNEVLLDLNIDSSSEKVISEHMKLLQNYSKVDFKSLIVDKVKFQKVMSRDSQNFASSFEQEMSKLAKFCNVEILVSDKVEYFSLPQEWARAEIAPAQNFYIYILGDSDDTIFAETRLRILIDNFLDSFIDSLEVSLSSLPLIGGINFGNFKSIAKETGVNIYLPTILPELYSKGNSKNHTLDIVFLTGVESSVLLAKKFLMELVAKVENDIFYKNIKVFKYKKDLILLNKKTELSSIMYRHGTFIQMAPLGDSSDSIVQFIGVSNELVEYAIEDFIKLTNEVFISRIWFHKDSIDDSKQVYHPAELKITVNELKNVIANLPISSGGFVYANYSISSFEIVGTREDCINLVEFFKIHANDIFVSFEQTVKLSVELSLSDHDFISGKKNGKILKIMNGSKSSSINFEPFNEYNLLVDLQSRDFYDFLKAFAELKNEFPSEFRFFIPEAFHRQIIGTGGSLIQSIMRKYNVFVKFSNSYDLKNNYKSHVRYDNVIIRCPFKNSANIPLVKDELNGLLKNNENTTFFNTFVRISKSQFRLFNYDKIQEIEKKTSTFVKFPQQEPLNYATIEVLGTENHSIKAAKMILNELPQSYEFKITYSNKFNKVFNDQNETYLDKIRVPFKLLYNFEIMSTDQETPGSVPCHSLVLTYFPESSKFLEDAISHLTSFLREYEFMISDRDELSNNDLLLDGSAANYTLFPNRSNNNNNNNNNTNTNINNGGARNSRTTKPFEPSKRYNSNIPEIPQSKVSQSMQQLYQLPNLQQQQIFTPSPTTLLQSFGTKITSTTQMRSVRQHHQTQEHFNKNSY